MNQDLKMLDTICESADMGRECISQVMKKTEGQKLKKALETQKREYDKIYEIAAEMMTDAGFDAPKAGTMAKMQSKMMVEMKTMLTSAENDSAVAEMMIQGSSMGVTKMTRELHEYEGNNKALRELAQRHIKTEQANIEEMKKYL